MPKKFLRSIFIRRILGCFLVLVGVAAISFLLSIRSWYKPELKLGQISPVTIVLRKDIRVFDEVNTKESQDRAKLAAIKNSENKEILEIDNKAKIKDFARLKLATRVVRQELSGIPMHIPPIHTEISMEVQDFLLHLNREKFDQLMLSADLEKELTDSNYFDFLLDLEFRKIITDELLHLSDLERKHFFLALDTIKKDLEEENKIKQSLGPNFFSLIRQTNCEIIFRKAYIVQKQLLDLGIVNGLPKNKIYENIQILFPNLSPLELNLIRTLIDATTYPNIEINWSKVHKLEKEATHSVNPVFIKLKAGSLLAKKGLKLEAKNFYYLKNLQMLNAERDWKEVLENFYLLLLFVFIIFVFIQFRQFKKYALRHCALFLIVPLIVSAIVATIALWGVDKLALAPIAIIGILITVFYSPGMAAVITTIFCYFLAKTVDMNFWQVLPQYFGSMIAIVLVRRAVQREDLTNAATQIAISQVMIFLVTVVIALADFEVIRVVIIAIFYAISGIISCLISIALLPYLESSLKLITPFKLTELSNSNQSLLKRLKEEAPGTYEHSLNVARFAEEACNLLHLNTELVRAGILYHDIGKLHSPDYFVENTLGKPNPHKDLDDPLKSAQIILAHVSEGIKLAKKNNLPQLIIDFIPMHQGTTITNYFYFQALERYGENNVQASDYRYPGPKPNTKETGIAMIADSTEAALRSIKDLADEQTAREMIQRIINARLTEEELDDSGLNKNDLESITIAFLNVWRSQNHERIKYPD